MEMTSRRANPYPSGPVVCLPLLLTANNVTKSTQTVVWNDDGRSEWSIPETWGPWEGDYYHPHTALFILFRLIICIFQLHVFVSISGGKSFHFIPHNWLTTECEWQRGLNDLCSLWSSLCPHQEIDSRVGLLAISDSSGRGGHAEDHNIIIVMISWSSVGWSVPSYASCPLNFDTSSSSLTVRKVNSSSDKFCPFNPTHWNLYSAKDDRRWNTLIQGNIILNNNHLGDDDDDDNDSVGNAYSLNPRRFICILWHEHATTTLRWTHSPTVSAILLSTSSSWWWWWSSSLHFDLILHSSDDHSGWRWRKDWWFSRWSLGKWICKWISGCTTV